MVSIHMTGTIGRSRSTFRPSCSATAAVVPEPQKTDFSVVRFRPNFMLVSGEHPMKVHKNQ